jgi:cytochrome bd-type quinol oxidase subunit 1
LGVPTATDRSSLLFALHYWGTTDVVVPMSRGWNTSAVARDPTAIADYLTQAFSVSPSVRHGAWTWHLTNGRFDQNP